MVQHDGADAADRSGSAGRGHHSQEERMAFRVQNCALMCFVSLFAVSFQARERKRPDEWSGFFLSDVPGRDSRAFKSSAYITICVRDSTGRNYGHTLA